MPTVEKRVRPVGAPREARVKDLPSRGPGRSKDAVENALQSESSAVRLFARWMMDEYDGDVHRAAEAIGKSEPLIYLILKGGREISPEIAKRLRRLTKNRLNLNNLLDPEFEFCQESQVIPAL